MSEKKPFYVRISEDLLKQYGQMPYYSPLPGERELCEIFHTSRPTIRKAVDLLEQDGKIVRLQGKGTFFIGDKPHIAHETNQVIGFYNDIRVQGKTPGSKVLFQNVEPASALVARQLGLQEGEQIFHLERLRFIEGEIYNLTNSYHPMSIGRELMKADFTTESLYDTLGKMGITLHHMDQVIEVKPADDYEAMHLDLAVWEPVVLRSCTTYDTTGQVVEFAQVKTQAYKTKFEMTVNR